MYLRTGWTYLRLPGETASKHSSSPSPRYSYERGYLPVLLSLLSRLGNRGERTLSLLFVSHFLSHRAAGAFSKCGVIQISNASDLCWKPHQNRIFGLFSSVWCLVAARRCCPIFYCNVEAAAARARVYRCVLSPTTRQHHGRTSGKTGSRSSLPRLPPTGGGAGRGKKGNKILRAAKDPTKPFPLDVDVYLQHRAPTAPRTTGSKRRKAGRGWIRGILYNIRAVKSETNCVFFSQKECSSFSYRSTIIIVL